MGDELADFDLASFEVPVSQHHQSQRGDGLPKVDRYGIGLSIPPRRHEDWIAKLAFDKLGGE